MVHENHGLGIYKGIEKIEVDHVAKDYMKIEYAGGSNLYILATQLDVIQKYAGRGSQNAQAEQTGQPGMEQDQNKGAQGCPGNCQRFGGALGGKAEGQRVCVRRRYGLAAGV